MEQPHLQANLDSFFARLAAAPQRALLLDYDGAVAPGVANGSQARPYPGMREALADMRNAGFTRIVIISGHSVTELERLLDLDPLPELWGSHGWERRLPDGAYLAPALSEQARIGLEEARILLEARGIGHLLDPQPASLALHWRGLDAAAVAALRETVGHLWTPIVLRSRLRVHPLDSGLELRAHGFDKGTAVRALLDELGPHAAIAYLGGDHTADVAFHALERRGLRVLVSPEHRPGAADIWLRPPDELLTFLHRWTRADMAPRPAPAREIASYERSRNA